VNRNFLGRELQSRLHSSSTLWFHFSSRKRIIGQISSDGPNDNLGKLRGSEESAIPPLANGVAFSSTSEDCLDLISVGIVIRFWYSSNKYQRRLLQIVINVSPKFKCLLWLFFASSTSSISTQPTSTYLWISTYIYISSKR